MISEIVVIELMCCVPLEISGVKNAEMQGKEEVLLYVFKVANMNFEV